MEHICFEVQLCSEILIFNENSNFWYTDHPEKSALILQSGIYVCTHTVRNVICIYMYMCVLRGVCQSFEVVHIQ